MYEAASSRVWCAMIDAASLSSIPCFFASDRIDRSIAATPTFLPDFLPGTHADQIRSDHAGSSRTRAGEVEAEEEEEEEVEA